MEQHNIKYQPIKIHTKVQKSNNPYQNHSFHTFFLFFFFFSSSPLLLLFSSSSLFFTLRFVLSKYVRPIWSHPILTFNFPFIALCPQTLLYLQIKLCHLYNNPPSSYIMSFVSHFNKLQIYPYILCKFWVSQISNLAK